MANKKLLNGEQKKVLYKLFEAKINERVSKIRNAFSTAENKLSRQLLDQAENNPAIKKLRATIKQAEIDSAKAEKEIGKLGFSLSYHKDELNIKNDHAELEKLSRANGKKLDKAETLKLKLLADIHGLPMTYDELTSYIEGELEKIVAE